MSEQAQNITYKKLAELSFDDLYVKEKTHIVPEIKTAVGHVYARIHRSSSRMPESLKLSGAQPLQQPRDLSRDSYIIPAFRNTASTQF
jgi:hypothetical protein